MARKSDNNRKCIRIHNEKVNDWVEGLPYGKFTELVNEFLEKEYNKLIEKVGR